MRAAPIVPRRDETGHVARARWFEAGTAGVIAARRGRQPTQDALEDRGFGELHRLPFRPGLCAEGAPPQADRRAAFASSTFAIWPRKPGCLDES